MNAKNNWNLVLIKRKLTFASTINQCSSKILEPKPKQYNECFMPIYNDFTIIFDNLGIYRYLNNVLNP